MQSISEINTSSEEGKMLFAAIVILSQSEKIMANGVEINGCQTTPDILLQKVTTLTDAMRNDF